METSLPSFAGAAALLQREDRANLQGLRRIARQASPRMTVVRTSYREIPPPPALSSRLVCLWASKAEGPDSLHEQQVLPDGCVDIVWVGDAEPIVAGPATRHTRVVLPVGVDIVGLRFRPGHVQALLGVPADELLDVSVSLAGIWGRAAARFGEAGRANRPADERLDSIADASLWHFADRPQADPAVATCVAWLGGRPAARIDDLRDVSDLSSRQLQRRFRSAVGYGPKTFQRIIRLQRLLDLSTRDGVRNLRLADLSAAAGYADQAHMSREVRDLTGQPPVSLLADGASTLAMSDLFKTAEGQDV